jgi:gentisate 1,2-dioxygenase
LVNDLDGIFFEPYPQHKHPVTQVNGSEQKYGGAHLKPTWENPPATRSPLLNYKWAPTYEALKRIGEGPASPFDDVCFEYLNPNTGGPTLPTMSCCVQLIRPGVHTQAHRQVNSAVYHVFEGRGHAVINGRRFDWEHGDFFVVPPWAWHEFANESKDEVILFSVQDTPVMQALGLYKEEAYRDNGGRQQVSGTFGG